MNQDQILSNVRSILKIVGAAVIAKGYGSDSQVETVIGALITVVGVVWSMKKHEVTNEKP